MQKIDFNKGWMCKCLTRDEAAYPVTLPHWMVHRRRLRVYQEIYRAERI